MDTWLSHLMIKDVAVADTVTPYQALGDAGRRVRFLSTAPGRADS